MRNLVLAAAAILGTLPVWHVIKETAPVSSVRL